VGLIRSKNDRCRIGDDKTRLRADSPRLKPLIRLEKGREKGRTPQKKGKLNGVKALASIGKLSVTAGVNVG
jgi:hypothetical protein